MLPLEEIFSFHARLLFINQTVGGFFFKIDDVSSNLKDLHLSREKFDPKKQRSKRPEIQRYVPKGRILEQQTKDDDISESETNLDVSPRKIDLKNDQQDLKVTVVVNEGASCPAQPIVVAKPEPKHPPNPHNPLDRTTKGESPKRQQSKTDTGNQSRGGQSGPQSNKPRHQRDNENKLKSGGRNFEEKRFGSGEGAQKRGQQHSGPGQGKQYDKGNHDDEFRRGEAKRGGFGRGRDNKRGGWQEEEPKPQRQPRERRDRVAESSGSDQKKADSAEREQGIKDIIPTMVFERKNGNNSPSESESSKQVQVTSGSNNGNGKPGSKRYSLSAMRRPRAGSISSDVSNTSDLSMDEETTNRILDWSVEVEREMAEQIQDETPKLQEYLDQKGGFNDWDGAIETVDKARQALERGQKMQRGGEERGYGKQGNRPYGNTKNLKNDRNYQDSHKEYENGFRQRRNSDGARSRRKDRHRKGSSAGRRSRDSSVSSAHSVRSYHTEDDMYGTDTWPRRRNRRKGSNASIKESRSKEVLNDPTSLNLKVTFARDEKRQVLMKDRESPKGRGRGRGRGHREDKEDVNVGKQSENSHRRGFEDKQAGRNGRASGNEYRQRRTSGDKRDGYGHYETKGGREYDHRYDRRNFGGHQTERERKKSPESTAHGGGIIKLPTNTDTSETHPQGQSNKQHVEFHTSGHRGERNRFAPRETHSHGNTGQRMLFDPKNPEKMIVVPGPAPSTPSSQLKFKDPSGPESPQSPPSQQHPLMPPPGGFPTMPSQYRGYPPFYGGYDPRYPDPMYGGAPMPGPPMPGYYYGYPGMYRDNPMLREDNAEFPG